MDADLLAAARAAEAEGRTPSLSAWVNDALRRQVEHDRRMRALDDFLASVEAAGGEITGEEIDDASRWARERAVVVRGRPVERTVPPELDDGSAA